MAVSNARRSTNRPWVNHPYLLTSIPPCFSFGDEVSDDDEKKYLDEYVDELRHNYLEQQVKINNKTIGKVIQLNPLKKKEKKQDWVIAYSIKVQQKTYTCKPVLDGTTLEIYYSI